MKRAVPLASALAFALFSGPARAETPPKAKAGKSTEAKAAPSKEETATAELKDAGGKKVGEALLEQTPHGVLLTVTLDAAPAGMHAFHIHDTGKCEGPAFKSAGGHFNPAGHKHGIKNPEGDHAGDMPNIDVAEGGKAKFQFLNEGVTLKRGEKNSLLKEGGTALVMHKGQDDHTSDPAGNAGDRIACGVILSH